MRAPFPLVFVFVALLSLSVVSSTAVAVVMSFVTGVAVSLAAVFLIVYLGLDSAEQYFDKKRNKFVAETKKEWSLTQLGLEASQLQGEIMVLVRPQNKDRVTVWYKATLKGNLLQFQESKPLIPDEPKRGTIVCDNLTVTVVKTKKGNVFKKTNYIEIAHDSRPLFAESKALYLFFKTRREMEEWYYCLQRASKFRLEDPDSPKFEGFRTLAKKFNPGVTAPAVEAPWFNALAQRIFFQYSTDRLLLETIKKKINKQFDKISKPDMIKALEVLEVKLDFSLPIFENFQLLQVTPSGSVKLATDVKYGGGFAMKINVIIETPKILDWVDAKILPAVLSARIRGITGKLVIHLAAPPSDRLWIGFDGEPEIDLKVETEIDLGMENQTFAISNQFPKLSKIIRALIRRELVETTLLPEMEDIPLPKIGKDSARDELKLDVPIQQRWESEEAARKAEEAEKKALEKSNEAKIAKEKAAALRQKVVTDEAAVKDTVVAHVASSHSTETSESSSKKEPSVRQSLFGSKDLKDTKGQPPSVNLQVGSKTAEKEDLTFGDALQNIDEALTTFLGSMASPSDPSKERKTKVDLVSEVASAAAQDVKNKVTSLFFGEPIARPASPDKELSSIEKKRRSSVEPRPASKSSPLSTSPTSSSVLSSSPSKFSANLTSNTTKSPLSTSPSQSSPSLSSSPPASSPVASNPKSSIFVAIPTNVVLPSSAPSPIESSETSSQTVSPQEPVISPESPPPPPPIVEDGDFPPALSVKTKEEEDIFGYAPSKTVSASPSLPTFDEDEVPVAAHPPVKTETPPPHHDTIDPPPDPLASSVIGMSTLTVIEDYEPPSPDMSIRLQTPDKTPVSTEVEEARKVVLSKPVDEDDFGYVSASDEDSLSTSPKKAGSLFSAPRKVSKPASETRQDFVPPIARSASPQNLLTSQVEQTPAPLFEIPTYSKPFSQAAPSTSMKAVEDDIFGAPPAVPARPSSSSLPPASSAPVIPARPANQWSATAGEKPLPQVPSTTPVEKTSRNPFKGLFGSKTSKEDSTLDSLKTSIIGLGDRVGSEHTGIASLDSALDSVFGSLSSKAKELSETSPRKKK